MNKPIYDRYEKADDGRLIIDVTVDRIEDLFNRFDRSAKYIKKDLDEEFAAYLVESVREVRKADFLIKVVVKNPVPEENKDRIRKSISNYFHYLLSVRDAESRKMFSRSVGYLFLGFVLIFTSLFLNAKTSAYPRLALRVFIEGITIAAWVSMWEAVANMIIEWRPNWIKRRVYRRIINSPVTIQTVIKGGQ